MKGIGGPLLCIGDLLSDLGEDNLKSNENKSSEETTSQSLHLPKLFEENFNSLNQALAGTQHSWTTLTLKLYSSVETANELIQLTNSNARLLLEKVEKLEEIAKRGDSAVAAARATCVSLSQDRLMRLAIQVPSKYDMAWILLMMTFFDVPSGIRKLHSKTMI